MERREKIEKLRREMEIAGIDGYIVPTSDPHQSEYLPAHWKIREWISGFTGSAGNLVITTDKAGLWTDGRYFIQAEQELSGSGIELFRSGERGVPPMFHWTIETVGSGKTVGLDGRLFSAKQLKSIREKFEKSGIKLKSDCELVEVLWTDRPPLPKESVFIHSIDYAGESRETKLSKVRAEMKAKGAEHYFISSLDDIAWLYNIRGRDIRCNPVTISYALLSMDKAMLFIDGEKLTPEVRAELETSGIDIEDYCEAERELSRIEGGSIYIDSHKVNSFLYGRLSENIKIIDGDDIVSGMKCIKNSIELENYRRCQKRDGVAMVKFLYWLENTVGKEPISEVTVAEVLEEFRSRGEHYIEPSFETIAGYRDHGAIVHYQADNESAYELDRDGLLLLDSGGQYMDGTTDITRTVSLGTPTLDEQRDYTLVLKGHISLAETVFPHGTTGSKLDSIARVPLWREGKDYRHGTGHGVGYLLSVHEGPQRISPHHNDTVLEEGMLITNEPGYYREGKYGIRIENVLAVREEKDTVYGKYLGFETTTYCPIDIDLVDVSLLSKRERRWLNSYHREVYRVLSHHLSDGERFWLKKKTREI